MFDWTGDRVLFLAEIPVMVGRYSGRIGLAVADMVRRAGPNDRLDP